MSRRHRHHDASTIALIAVGAPFYALIKVSLLVFVALVVGPFWLLVKLVQTVAVVVAHVAGQARISRQRRVAQARIDQHARQARQPRPQAYYSNRR